MLIFKNLTTELLKLNLENLSEEHNFEDETNLKNSFYEIKLVESNYEYQAGERLATKTEVFQQINEVKGLIPYWHIAIFKEADQFYKIHCSARDYHIQSCTEAHAKSLGHKLIYKPLSYSFSNALPVKIVDRDQIKSYERLATRTEVLAQLDHVKRIIPDWYIASFFENDQFYKIHCGNREYAIEECTAEHANQLGHRVVMTSISSVKRELNALLSRLSAYDLASSPPIDNFLRSGFDFFRSNPLFSGNFTVELWFGILLMEKIETTKNKISLDESQKVVFFQKLYIKIFHNELISLNKTVYDLNPDDIFELCKSVFGDIKHGGYHNFVIGEESYRCLEMPFSKSVTIYGSDSVSDNLTDNYFEFSSLDSDYMSDIGVLCTNKDYPKIHSSRQSMWLSGIDYCDVIGCGYDSASKSVYFTLNGKLNKRWRIRTNQDGLFIPEFSFLIRPDDRQFKIGPRNGGRIVLKILDRKDFLFDLNSLHNTSEHDPSKIIKEEFCCICMENEPTILMVPCHHLLMCSSCYDEKSTDDEYSDSDDEYDSDYSIDEFEIDGLDRDKFKKCPMCRRKVNFSKNLTAIE